MRLTTSSGPVVIMNVYRPGSERPSSLFFEELTEVLETLVVHCCPVVIGGDFNVHVQDANDPDTRRLSSLLSSFDMVQHVHSPTHRCGNTLDLVMTFADRAPDDVTVQPPGVISDHALVTCQLPVAVDPPPLTERLVRGWRRVDREKLRRTLEASQLCDAVPAGADMGQLFTTYNMVLHDIADQLAPSHVIRRRPGHPIHRGLTPSAEPSVASVIVWNVATVAHAACTIADYGWKLRATGSEHIERRKSATGLIV